MFHVLHVVGTRPNFVKMAPVIEALAARPDVSQTVVHTGQHYDKRMSSEMLHDLEFPSPDIFLSVGSGTHAEQTGRALIKVEEVLLERRPDLVCVGGDVNSTLAGALAATKLALPVAHVEAGLRSFDWTMPEEVNRVLTDRLSDMLFTHSPEAAENLAAEGIDPERVHFVGNTMIDSLLRFEDAARRATALGGSRRARGRVRARHAASPVECRFSPAAAAHRHGARDGGRGAPRWYFRCTRGRVTGSRRWVSYPCSSEPTCAAPSPSGTWTSWAWRSGRAQSSPTRAACRRRRPRSACRATRCARIRSGRSRSHTARTRCWERTRPPSPASACGRAQSAGRRSQAGTGTPESASPQCWPGHGERWTADAGVPIAERGHAALRGRPAGGSPERVRVLGCEIDRLDMDEVVAHCERSIDTRTPTQHMAVNAAKVVAMQDDEHLRQIVNRCELVTADGQSVVWASRLLGTPLPSRVTGIDLMHELFELAERKRYRVYVLGARREVLDRALDRLRELHPELAIAGYRDGYFTEQEEEAEVAAQIRQARADMLFVAMSSPSKEYFLARWGAELDVPFSMGVGGAIDVLAGVTRRAPGFSQRMGLEWAFRLAQEPRRLFRRYLVTNSRFVLLTLRQAVQRGLGRIESA